MMLLDVAQPAALGLTVVSLNHRLFVLVLRCNLRAAAFCKGMLLIAGGSS